MIDTRKTYLVYRLFMILAEIERVITVYYFALIAHFPFPISHPLIQPTSPCFHASISLFMSRFLSPSFSSSSSSSSSLLKPFLLLPAPSPPPLPSHLYLPTHSKFSNTYQTQSLLFFYNSHRRFSPSFSFGFFIYHCTLLTAM